MTPDEKREAMRRRKAKLDERRKGGKQLPTFATAPLDLLPENIVGLKVQMEDLDAQHKRATSPRQRMRIEGKMRALLAEVKKIERLEASLDRAAAAWWASIEKSLG